MAPGAVTTDVGRLVDGGDGSASTSPTWQSGLAALTDDAVWSDAAKELATSDLHAVVYASTTTGYALGFDAEAELVARIAQLTGLPSAATCTSTVHACHVLGVRRLALVGAPWFEPRMNELGAAYFSDVGLDVVSSESADLPLDPMAIEADGVAEWVLRRVDRQADAVFVGGNGFRAVGAIQAIEAGLDLPVLTSNQVLLWQVLRSTDSGVAIGARYGRLFATGGGPTR